MYHLDVDSKVPVDLLLNICKQPEFPYFYIQVMDFVQLSVYDKSCNNIAY